jgi:hypothetical protein
MAQRGYLTNIASEFFVVSLLSRLGLDASLTLGNKKQVDIVVAFDEGKAITIDVKAVAGKMDWLLGNSTPKAKPGHFVFFVAYEGKFNEPLLPPRVWVVPASKVGLHTKVAANGKTHYVPRKAFLESGTAYESAWELLRGDA